MCESAQQKYIDNSLKCRINDATWIQYQKNNIGQINCIQRKKIGRIIGVEFFDFLVARIFHVKIPGNGRNGICVVQNAICPESTN